VQWRSTDVGNLTEVFRGKIAEKFRERVRFPPPRLRSLRSLVSGHRCRAMRRPRLSREFDATSSLWLRVSGCSATMHCRSRAELVITRLAGVHLPVTLRTKSTICVPAVSRVVPRSAARVAWSLPWMYASSARPPAANI
jgi:hypothetical protein